MLGGSPSTINEQPSTSLLYSGEQFDPHLQMAYHRARYYDQSVGLWNRLDPFSGNHSDPQSLHKYSYCHDSPLNLSDPSGEAVWVVTRPLNISGARRLAPTLEHVFLVFTEDGLTPGEITAWQKRVSEANNPANLPHDPAGNILVMPGIYPYSGITDVVTFSYHPVNVLLNVSGGQFSETSYVAYNDAVDIQAFKNPGPQARRYQVISCSADEQFTLYEDAISSRNINNQAPKSIEPEGYYLTSFNCGSWSRHIVGYPGFPEAAANIGIGTTFDILPPVSTIGTGSQDINTGIVILRAEF
jgi:RHS repeat-associated protein